MRPALQLAPRDKIAWAVSALEKFWPALLKKVPEKELPVGPGFEEELGCGVYGCVWNTQSPGIVIKVTTDRTEAAFVAAALRLPKQPVGIVRYYRLLQLGGYTYKRKQVYLLWREIASSPGFIRKDDRSGVSWDDREVIRQAGDYLGSFKAHAQEVRSYLMGRVGNAAKCGQEVWDLGTTEKYQGLAIGATSDSSHWRGVKVSYFLNEFDPWWGEKTADQPVRRAAINLASCFRIARMFAEDPLIDPPGPEAGGSYEYGLVWVPRALEYYLSYGILLSDVHSGNVGIGRPLNLDDPYADYRAVITDPGQAVFLGERWKQITVPVLREPKTRKIKSAWTMEEVRKKIEDKYRSLGHGSWYEQLVHGKWRSRVFGSTEPESLLLGEVRYTPTGPNTFRMEFIGPEYKLMGVIDAKLTAKGVKLSVRASSFFSSTWKDLWQDLRHDPSVKKTWRAKVIEDMGEPERASASPNPGI